MRRFARAAIEVARLACARERLDEAPPAAAPAASRRDAGRILRALFAIEPLPVDPPPPPAQPRRGWLHWLFAPEKLPYAPEPPSRRRQGRLAALFARERLDDSP